MAPGFKRFLALLIITGTICMVHFLTGCAIISAERQRHTKAEQELSILETKYTKEFKNADFHTQVQWRYRIDPQLRKARFALFSWDIALSVKENVIALEKERAFLNAKEKLILIYEIK